MQNTKCLYTRSDFKSILQNGLYVEHAILDYDFPQHSHSFNEAFVILSGRAQHVLGTTEYTLERGDVFAIKGNTSHGFRGVHRLEIINLMYDPRIFLLSTPDLRTIPGFEPLFMIEPEIRQITDYPSALKLGSDALTYVKMLVLFIAEQQQRDSQALRPVIRLSFMALVAYLSAQYDASGGQSEKIKTLARALNCMEMNLNRQIKLEEIASEAYISKRHLERLFSEFYGDTPKGYLQRMRLNRALALLIKNGSSVNEAAQLSGFTDTAYFVRVFREAYGITPAKAKRLIRGLDAQINDPDAPEKHGVLLSSTSSSP
jgi:AraC-like DNA-binding protein